jgi:hypothetical protein
MLKLKILLEQYWELPNNIKHKKTTKSKSTNTVTPKKQSDSKTKKSTKTNLTTKSINTTNAPTNPDSVSTDIVIFMAGLDDQKDPTYKSVEEQANLLATNLTGKTIIKHDYRKSAPVINSIKNNPGAIVILFSAGCGYSSIIAKAMADKTKLYIVEPYAISSNTVISVRNAVSQGVPAANVLTGDTKGRGKGTIEGSTQTPNVKGPGLSSHWNALKFVGTLI